MIEAHEQIFMNQTVRSLKPSNYTQRDYKLGNNHLVNNSAKNREFTLSNHSDKENINRFKMQRIPKAKGKVEQKMRLSKVLKMSNQQRYYNL